MDFGIASGRRKKAFKSNKIGSNGSGSHYHHGLQFYVLPPIDNITLQEFEEFASERVKVLKAVETVGIRLVKGSNEYTSAMDIELKKSKMKAFKPDSSPDIQERRKDHVSHFILRLAYCKSEDLKRWFIAQEVDMFRHRFNQETQDSIKKFLEVNKLDYVPIPDSEKNEICDKLVDSTYDMTHSKIEGTDYFKVPFFEAHDLVRSRKIFVHGGYGYVPRSDLVSLIIGVFRTNLSHALAVTARALPNLEEDDRLVPILNGLNKGYYGQDYSNNKPTAGVITSNMVDEISKKSFPLCMQQLHQNLRQHHHLKHGGRMQYGLFLKAIGMTLEEAMKFWRAEFTKIIDVDKFDKQYSYNIRHNYGKEGKRADYTPYSCIKIIMSNTPGQGDSHGCPFKHSDAGLLRQRLQSLRITKDGVDQVMDFVKGGHYQLACGQFFELTHSLTDSSVAINHPNQYFEESVKVESGERKREVAPQTEVRIVKGVSQTHKGNKDESASNKIFTMEDDAELDDKILLECEMD